LSDLSPLPSPFREAVAAIDAGDVSALETLLAEHPRLLRDRIETGEGYFHRPYLLWFVAENPIRNDRLPRNIAEVTRLLLEKARSQGVDSLPVDSLPEQLDSTLGLVGSGRVPREQGVQGELIDLLVDSGANPDKALASALAHRETTAVERLLERGARLTLLAAACLGRKDDVARLLPAATAEDRQAALAGAALHGQAEILRLLIDRGVDLNAYNPPGFHAHGTALHHAVDSGSLEAVQVLVAAGADLGIQDRLYQGTPLGWAEYLNRPEIASFLRTTTEARP
jgi:peptide-methionine (S)-S-oxide reductase